jgi:hypothetical protein
VLTQGVLPGTVAPLSGKGIAAILHVLHFRHEALSDLHFTPHIMNSHESDVLKDKDPSKDLAWWSPNIDHKITPEVRYASVALTSAWISADSGSCRFDVC